MYDDDYATCEETYATLSLYSDDLDPEAITRDLGIQPTCTQKGDRIQDADTGEAVPVTSNAWFLESRGVVHSRDVRRHVDWVLDQVEPKQDALNRLREANCKSVLSCFWVSAHWHGGPMLCPAQMARLAALGLEVWWDIYFAPIDDDTGGDGGDEGAGLVPLPPIADRDLEPDWKGVGQRSPMPAGRR